jgi:hypothetical protein
MCASHSQSVWRARGRCEAATHLVLDRYSEFLHLLDYALRVPVVSADTKKNLSSTKAAGKGSRDNRKSLL